MYDLAYLSYIIFLLLAGDPNAIVKVPGRMDVNYLENSVNKENLQLLNLM